MCELNESVVTTVLIVEDHPMTRDGLKAYLGTADDIEVIGCTEDGEEAVALVQDRVPDVVLMDLELERSDIDGAEATRQITRISPSTQVLAVTAHSENSYIFSALKAGAMGYVLKSAPSDEIIDAVRSVARRQPVLDRDVFERMRQFIGMGEDMFDSDAAPNLTPREEEVLDLLAEGLSNQDIAEALVISVKTVKTHVSNILQKLHLSNRQEARFWLMQHRAKLREA